MDGWWYANGGSAQEVKDDVAKTHLELALREIFRERGGRPTQSDPSSSVNSRAVTGLARQRSQGMLPEADCTSVKRRHQTTREARGTASQYCKLARPSIHTQRRTDSPSSLPSKPIGRPRRPVHPRPWLPNPRSCEQLPTQCAIRDTTLIHVFSQLALPPFPQTRP
jgi:hypothetical protein